MPKPPPQDPPHPARRSASPAAALHAIADSAWAGQHAQAVALADEALALPGLSLALQLELLDRRAESRLALGDIAQALADAQAMEQRADNPALQALALCRLAAVRLRQGQWAAAESAARQALAAARGARKRWLQAMAWFRLSEAQFRQYDNTTALRSASSPSSCSRRSATASGRAARCGPRPLRTTSSARRAIASAKAWPAWRWPGKAATTKASAPRPTWSTASMPTWRSGSRA